MNRYEIRVVGHLDARRARALGADECRRLPDGNSILVVTAVDQAATYGLLARIRDAGLELVAVGAHPPVAAGHTTRRRAKVEERDGRWMPTSLAGRDRSCANGRNACAPRHGTSDWRSARAASAPPVAGPGQSNAHRRVGARRRRDRRNRPMKLLRNLGRRKVRTVLTILGITIGIWALVVFGSMANKINSLVAGGSTYYEGKIFGQRQGRRDGRRWPDGHLARRPDHCAARCRRGGSGRGDAAVRRAERHVDGHAPDDHGRRGRRRQGPGDIPDPLRLRARPHRDRRGLERRRLGFRPGPPARHARR